MHDVKVAIHQPNYLPWYGFFRKMMMSDIFIILDTAQYSKNGYQNRVRIKGPQGDQWLTQPVSLAGNSFAKTMDISFAEYKWKRKHVSTLKMNYSKAKYFQRYIDDLENLYASETMKLAEFNEAMIRWMAKEFRIKCEIKLASEMPSDLQSTARLVELIKGVNGAIYLSGSGGRNYQDECMFNERGIEVHYVEANSAEYPQVWGEFVEGLSAIDLLLNCGDESHRYLLGE